MKFVQVEEPFIGESYTGLRLTPNRVYIRPFDGGGNLGGFGYGGFNAGYGWGAANGFAFGAIASLVFLAFLW
ncbi:hypothetical protein J7E95_18170 [Streptomyces sp. ISL-14]|uniref:hypothetical protein n=1 Tax=Bacillus sp. ISL-4 TaxID=2819125 RepID=UPI001C196ABC|nr:hypothetical protein [Bacillus sp. ISL-4]MBT2672748.1 hypothetical protein [Streptomyces sp. ISL-14]